MGKAIQWGLVLAVCVTALNVVLILSGLHENPFVGGIGALLVYIVLNIVIVILALMQTRGENGYGKQLTKAVVVGIAAGAAIFVSSYLTMAVVFPNALEETKQGFIALVESTGLPEAQLEAQRAQIDKMTPLGEALKGMIGTFATSLIVGAIAAIFLRRK